MITKELTLFTFDNGSLKPDRIRPNSEGHYLHYAELMLQTYRTGIGKTRGALHTAIQRIFDKENCHPRRIKSFIHILDQASEFEMRAADIPWKLRMEVFKIAGMRHPVVLSKEDIFDSLCEEVHNQTATELGRPWPEIEANLFADLLDANILVKFELGDASAFLNQYNLAQAQAALYNATEVRVDASADLRAIRMAAKFNNLVHKIELVRPDTYRFTLSGAVSDLQKTHRYGASMAKFLATLARCQNWKLQADIQLSNSRTRYYVDSTRRLGEHLPPLQLFTSSVEEKLMSKWGTEPQNGWILKRESKILHCGQKVFFPDFSLVHDSGTEVLFEVIGFWTPEYLLEKKAILQQFPNQPFLLAIQENSADIFRDLPIPIVTYKSSIKIEDVLKAIGGLTAASI